MKTSRQKVYCFPSSIDLALASQAEALKEENDSLRWQLDAYRNEVELLKQEQGKAHREDDPNKEQQLKLLQQALQGMQQVRTGCLEEQHPLCFLTGVLKQNDQKLLQAIGTAEVFMKSLNYLHMIKCGSVSIYLVKTTKYSLLEEITEHFLLYFHENGDHVVRIVF